MQDRIVIIDILKILAAQLIFWHHWSAYTPMADVVALTWPSGVNFFYHSARMAVQVFLVCAGFLSAKTFVNQNVDQFLSPIMERYLRLVPLYLLAICVTAILSFMLAQGMTPRILPTQEGLFQWMAHILLLQDILHMPAMSAGIWYVAIDLQLFACLCLLLWVLKNSNQQMHVVKASVGIAILTLASAWFFNLQPEWDGWAVYFFAAYGLGVLTAWASIYKQSLMVWIMCILLLALSCWVYPRDRLLLSLATSLILIMANNWRIQSYSIHRWIDGLSNSTYALFLFHFPFLMLMTALWGVLGIDSFNWALIYSITGCLAMGLLSLGLNAWVETPIKRWTR